MRKNFLNRSFTYIDRKKENILHPPPTFLGKIGPPKQKFAPVPRISLIGPAWVTLNIGVHE
jgi:hypothetical protein